MKRCNSRERPDGARCDKPHGHEWSHSGYVADTLYVWAREREWGVFRYDPLNRYRREDAISVRRSRAAAERAADALDCVVREVLS